MAFNLFGLGKGSATPSNPPLPPAPPAPSSGPTDISGPVGMGDSGAFTPPPPPAPPAPSFTAPNDVDVEGQENNVPIIKDSVEENSSDDSLSDDTNNSDINDSPDTLPDLPPITPVDIEDDAQSPTISSDKESDSNIDSDEFENNDLNVVTPDDIKEQEEDPVVLDISDFMSEPAKDEESPETVAIESNKSPEESPNIEPSRPVFSVEKMADDGTLPENIAEDWKDQDSETSQAKGVEKVEEELTPIIPLPDDKPAEVPPIPEEISQDSKEYNTASTDTDNTQTTPTPAFPTASPVAPVYNFSDSTEERVRQVLQEEIERDKAAVQMMEDTVNGKQKEIGDKQSELDRLKSELEGAKNNLEEMRTKLQDKQVEADQKAAKVDSILDQL